MEENIKSFIDNNTLKEFFTYPKEELEIIRLYINLNLFDINRKSRYSLDKSGEEEPDSIQTIKMSSNKSYNCLDYMLSYILKVDMITVSVENELQKITNQALNNYTNHENNIYIKLITLLNEVDEYNLVNTKKIKYLDVK